MNAACQRRLVPLAAVIAAAVACGVDEPTGSDQVITQVVGDYDLSTVNSVELGDSALIYEVSDGCTVNEAPDTLRVFATVGALRLRADSSFFLLWIQRASCGSSGGWTTGTEVFRGPYATSGVLYNNINFFDSLNTATSISDVGRVLSRDELTGRAERIVLAFEATIARQTVRYGMTFERRGL